MNPAVILVVEDDPLQRKLIRENLEAEGYAVVEAAGGRDALETARRASVDVAIVDYRLGEESGTDVVEALVRDNPLLTPLMVTAYGNIERAVEAMRRGAYDYLVKPIDFEKLRPVLTRALERRRLKREVAGLRDALSEKFSFRNFVYASPLMEDVARLVATASRSDATVLILGETGTGKDLVARTVHYSSRRKDGPYLAVNIPSLPESLVEAELFGAERGAFTGAHERRTGLVEAAAGGTLLLDEIGDLPLHVQVKLLRFLQDREFFRLGSSRPQRSDVRLIAATNRDLEKLMAEDKFRPDLYYRLDVVRIRVPPLRERKEDIPALVDHFLLKYAARERKPLTGISREAMDALLRHPFPGNVRELENAVERAVVFADGPDVRLTDLPVFVRERTEAEAEEPAGQTLPDKVRRLEIWEIRKALRKNGGIKSRAARALGLTERILAYKIKHYGLDAGPADGEPGD